jgi:hypothetical protein
MRYALTYPPEFDGELHLEVEDAENGPFLTRTITVRISVARDELPKDTIRIVGADMARQPMRRLGD